MGYGNYSHEAHDALLRGRARLPAQKVFAQRECHPLMNPKGIRLREARDSAEHPSSLPIVFALDVTGSMGLIPKALATQQLPHFMKTLTDCGVADPQLLFMAVGDATSDRAPLQVGQFESTAQLMDQWLTWSYLEGNGGGTGEESYELAMYLLAQHTEMDSWLKRKKRAYMFMTGDELPYPLLSRHIVGSVIGDNLDEDLKVEEVVAELQKTFHPYFVIPSPDRRSRCEARWRGLLGENVLCLESPEDICSATAGVVLLTEGLVTGKDQLHDALAKTGITKDRLTATVRALQPLAQVLERGLPALPRAEGAENAGGGGIKRLFQLFPKK